ncbi:MAG: N-acetyltransferase [Fidelibacterota bacterium]
MSVRLIKVEDKKGLNRFIKFAWKIYKGDPYWVPPLISEQKKFFNPSVNPFFQHSEVDFFLVEKNGELSGRIAAILNRNHNEFQGERTGFFGFFESVNDREVSDTLFDAAAEWLKKRGMEVMRGPMNFSTNDECGLLVEGFNSSPVIMMTYNPPYYSELIENYGFKKAKDLYAYMIDNPEPPEKLVRGVELIKRKKNISLRNVNLKKFDEEVEVIHDIYNSAWEKNWGFIPMTDDEFYYLAKNLKTIVNPELAFIAEVNGLPAGFSLAIPNVNEALIKINGRLFPSGFIKLLWYFKKIKSLRIITMGVKKEFRFMGIDALFYLETFRAGVRRGYKWAEMSWILEDNLMMIRALEDLNARRYKTYRIYDLPLT